MKFFKQIINDDVWNIYLADEVDIESLFDNENKAAAAFTESGKKEMYFDKADLTKDIVRHELTHVAFYYMYLTDANMTFDDVEEVMASFMEHRLDWFVQKSDEIYLKLEELKKNWYTEDDEEK